MKNKTLNPKHKRQGITKIQALEEYVGLRTVYLECNGIDKLYQWFYTNLINLAYNKDETNYYFCILQIIKLMNKIYTINFSNGFWIMQLYQN